MTHSHCLLQTLGPKHMNLAQTIDDPKYSGRLKFVRKMGLRPSGTQGQRHKAVLLWSSI